MENSIKAYHAGSILWCYEPSYWRWWLRDGLVVGVFAKLDSGRRSK
jgi:hypothetical protein